MKKHWLVMGLITVVISISVFVSACVARKGEPLKQKIFAPQNERIANGQTVFMANCNKCHPGGEGGLAPAINSNPAPQFIKRFQMRHGLGVMPSFKKDEISKKDLHDISKFLHAWKTY
jgi:mono/diheme cytochrome c family protein